MTKKGGYRLLVWGPEDDIVMLGEAYLIVIAGYASLVPEGEGLALAAVLATQLGRGGRETQLSLSQALVALGEVIVPVLLRAERAPDPRTRAHALATQRLPRDPDAGFTFAIEEAKRAWRSAGPARRDDEAC